MTTIRSKSRSTSDRRREVPPVLRLILACAAMVLWSAPLTSCAVLAGAAAGGATGYVAGHHAGEEEAEEELERRDND